MSRYQFFSQIQDVSWQNSLEAKAPNPADHPTETTVGPNYQIGEHQIEHKERFSISCLPEEVDVVIIGSSIAGATIAYRMAQEQPGLMATVLEARGLCTRATGRNDVENPPDFKTRHTLVRMYCNLLCNTSQIPRKFFVHHTNSKGVEYFKLAFKDRIADKQRWSEG